MTLSPEQFRQIEDLYHRLEGCSEQQVLSELRRLGESAPEVADALAALLLSTTSTSGSAFSALARDAQEMIAQTAVTPSPRATSTRRDPVPEHIGRYRIVRLLGEGGMGQVFEAEQLEPVHRSVAIKVVRHNLDSAEVLARFRAEQQALAVMNHNHIARVLDADISEDGRPYFVMELVPGIPITRYCDHHELSIEQRIELFEDVLSAVQHAHQKGIIHRDLKPSNILVAAPPQAAAGDAEPMEQSSGGSGSGNWPRDRRPIVKVIDFGIAKATEASLLEESEATRIGDLVGTPEYMSPEQASLGDVDIDVRSDVYSLGLVLYELLTGALPITGHELRSEGFDAMRRIIREREVPKASDRVASVSTSKPETTSISAARRKLEPPSLRRRLRGDLDWILLRALEKDRTQRYDSVASFATDLRRHLDDEPVSAGPPTVRYRLSKFVRRNRLAVAAAALLTVALLVGLTGATIGLLSARRSAAEAQEARTLADQQAEAAERTAQFLGRLFRSADPRERAGIEISVDEILRAGVEQIDELDDQPATQLRLLGLFGDVYRSRGDFETAEPILRRLLEFDADAAFVPQATQERERLLAATALAGILRDRNELEQAEVTLRRGLEQAEGWVEPIDDAYGATANSLGTVLRHLRRYDEAEAWYRRALVAVEANEQPPGPNAGTIYNNLATIANFREEFAQGEELNRKAIELFAGRLPPLHPAFGTLFMNRSVALRNVADLPRAVDSAQRAVDITRQSLGDDHFSLGVALFNLGWAQEAFGRYANAESSLREGIEIMEKTVGLVGTTGDGLQTKLASTLAAAGRLEEAQRVFDRFFEVAAARSDDNRTAIINARLDYAHWLRLGGRLDAAEGQITQALSEADACAEEGPKSWARLAHAHLLLAQGNPESAETEYSAAMRIADCSAEQSCYLDDPASRFTRASYLALAGRTQPALDAIRFWSAQRHRLLDALASPDFDSMRDSESFVAAERRWRDAVRSGNRSIPPLDLPEAFG